jgi:hypothetical protein
MTSKDENNGRQQCFPVESFAKQLFYLSVCSKLSTFARSFCKKERSRVNNEAKTSKASVLELPAIATF